MLGGEHSAILSTFIKLPFVIKIFVLSIFEWPFYTSFTVLHGIVLLKGDLGFDVAKPVFGVSYKRDYSQSPPLQSLARKLNFPV